MRPLEKYLLSALLLAAGLIGLGMTLCGAAFSVMAPEGPGILLISLPSLALGLVILRVAVVQWRKLRAN